MTELEKLEEYLKEHDYNYRWNSVCRGYEGYPCQDQIIVYRPGHERSWDVVCHYFSYDRPDGLLELYGELCTDVIGWLTADDVIRILEYFKAKGSNREPIDKLCDINEK